MKFWNILKCYFALMKDWRQMYISSAPVIQWTGSWIRPPKSLLLCTHVCLSNHWISTFPSFLYFAHLILFLNNWYSVFPLSLHVWLVITLYLKFLLGVSDIFLSCDHENITKLHCCGITSYKNGGSYIIQWGPTGKKRCFFFYKKVMIIPTKVPQSLNCSQC